MKKYLILFISIFITILNCIPAFAEWQQDANGWWYHITTNVTQGAPTKDYGQSGKYATGKYWYIDGKYYVFDDNGLMKANTTIDGHQLNSDGQLLDDNGQVYTKSPSEVSPKGFLSCVNSCYGKITGSYSQSSVGKLKVEGYDLHYRKDCSGFVSICVELFNILNYNNPASEPIFSTANFTNLNAFHCTNVSSGYITNMNYKPGDIWIKPRTQESGNGNGHAIILTEVKQTSNGPQYTFKHLTSSGKKISKVKGFSSATDNEGHDGLRPNGGDFGSEGYSVFYRAQ